MAIEHDSISDSELHEPRGVASATANQVYLADGSGSGSWTDIVPDNIVLVQSSSDFPASSGGVITLADNTLYQVSGSIDIGSDRIVAGSNSVVQGTSEALDSITSSTAGTMFTASSGFRMGSFSITCSSGTVFDLSGGAFDVFILRSLRVVSCATLGSVGTCAVFVWTDAAIVDITTDGLSFSGNVANIKIRSTTWSSVAGTGIDLGTCTSDLIAIDDVNIITDSGATGISIAANSANINSGGIGIVRASRIGGPGTAISGYDPGDDSWEVFSNSGVQSSRSLGSGYATGNSTETSISTVSTPVQIDLNSSVTADSEDKFSVSSAGAFTYDGDTGVAGVMSASLFCDAASGTNVNFRFYFAKNGTVITSTVTQDEFDSGDPHSVHVSGVTDLDSGDVITMYVENITNTTNITVETASIDILGV